MQDPTAADIIRNLDLKPHPEGGWYRQTWISDMPVAGGRASATCIYFLLKARERSHWHRVDATEIWLFHAGAPLVLSLSETETGPATDHLLSPDPTRGAPQVIVPPHHWQSARSTGDYTLVSCAVSPGFRFDGFTLADPTFDIPRIKTTP
ncbi:cupin domain-containing protein [Pukyongiella litopenaei]|uniref:Cupin domain-containing protein n=1 Tax=Pukyongiella litopenaei TaxID=2605946 RepID=A0A2S0MUJ3_9RHOB|nr:cupin domain-containing protein [Pukyongiella litopenaei]AVO39532.1 cupin domain-containing protein [Pukyongiella litopenaei]